MTTSLSYNFVNKFYSITDSLHIFYEMESIMSGQLKTMDGNMAAAYVSYAFTETATIYPITPSSPIADYTSIWALNKRKIYSDTL